MLAEKIKAGRHRLETFFPDFANYQLPGDAVYGANDDPLVVKAKYFIRGEFLVSPEFLFVHRYFGVVIPCTQKPKINGRCVSTHPTNKTGLSHKLFLKIAPLLLFLVTQTNKAKFSG
jgi:hypothetical protein